MIRERRFIGIDLNPVAVALTRLIVEPPAPELVLHATRQIEKRTKDNINESYVLHDATTIASHFLWERDELQKIWVTNGYRRRLELEPTPHDLALCDTYSEYASQGIRRPRFFSNGRINSAPTMTLDDLLTGRAQRNIDLLLDAIENCEDSIIPAMRLCLTAASGQMTKMVFAVTGRGKTSGKKATKIEVGSWVIGFWRPKLHFEVNVWNCFYRRLRKLRNAALEVRDDAKYRVSDSLLSVLDGRSEACVKCDDCREVLRTLPDACIDLIVTDPPHGDRVPYLELSEYWNSILGVTPSFEKEVVVSNAKERHLDARAYSAGLGDCLAEMARVLSPRGYLVVFFNSRKRDTWAALRGALNGTNNSAPLRYLGCFPCTYSVGSVVQDARKGALKHDIAIVCERVTERASSNQDHHALAKFPGWSIERPSSLME